MSRRLVIAALAAGPALALLGGCSDDTPRPKIAPSDSSSVAASPSPSPTGPVEPTLPPEAQKPTKAGAEAFAVHYWELADYAQNTGDVSGLSSMGICPACSAGIEYIETTYREGGRIEGGTGPAAVVSTELINDDGSRPSFGLTVRVTNGDQVVDFPGKKRDRRLPGGTIRIRMVVTWLSSGWTVSRWDRE